MRIMIDLQGLQSESRHRGIGRYSLALTTSILKNRGEHEIFILLNNYFEKTIDEVKNSLAGLVLENNFIIFDVLNTADCNESSGVWRVKAAEILRENIINDFNPDVLLIGSLFEGAADGAITSIGRLPSRVKTAVILYDLIPYIDPEQYLSSISYRNWYLEKIESLKRADLLLSISNSAKYEAIEKLSFGEESVSNISCAANSNFKKLNLSSHSRNNLHIKFGIKNKFIMHVGAMEKRKNFENLIMAFGLIPRDVRSEFQLLLVCKVNETQIKQFGDFAKSVGLSSEELIFSGAVDDDDLISLYSECYLFAFPSLHEGFGLPVLEAMCCEAAVIGSNSSSIPEIIGKTDALFDPTSASSIANIIQLAITDEKFWESLKTNSKIQSKKFSWDAVANSAIKEFENLFSKKISLDNISSDFILINEIAAIKSDLNPSAYDLMEVASSIDRNENSVYRKKAYSSFCGVINWRIEGPFDSTYSLALLNRETALSIGELGHNVILHSPDYKVSDEYLDKNAILSTMHDRVIDFSPELVDVLSRNNYPPLVEDMRGGFNLLHHYAWEETGYPHDWIDKFNNHLNGISCLSNHVEKILIDNGISIPMSTTGCGVDHWERVQVDLSYKIKAKKFRFLHVSSCFPRKGADLLLDSYGRTFTSNDDVTLVIKTFDNIHNNIRELLEERKFKNPSFPEVLLIFGDIGDSELKSLYAQCHVLVAPSCAEGFGLPMAEALLTGLPVITTNWGGQLDFCNERNSWLVDFNFAKAKSHFNIFYSAWAEVDVDALAVALKEAFLSPLSHLKEKALSGRNLLLQNYKWSDTAIRLVNSAKKWRINEDDELLPKVGWLTTWNTKCGIATYSEHLVNQLPEGVVTIFSPVSIGLMRADSKQCVRYDPSGGKLRLNSEIIKRKINTIVIQFNYGLYDFDGLSEFILEQERNGLIIIFVMHATGEFDSNVKLLPALRKCHRILVHSIDDLNRLKKHGLINNVAMFPHGVLNVAVDARHVENKKTPLIASYGFCLPHKGLAELVQSISILKTQGVNVRLRLVNAEYPAVTSSKLVGELRDLIKTLEIGDRVEMHTDFLEDSKSLQLLSEADLIVYPYQHTGESASGAVRYGLATKRPIAVTPIKIFDDIGDSAFRFSGTSSQDIANGILDILGDLNNFSSKAAHVKSTAQNWLNQHDYTTVSRRLLNLVTALLRKKPKRTLIFNGSSRRLNSVVGRVEGRKLFTTGNSGNLICGPCSNLIAGNYEIKIFGLLGKSGLGNARVDVSLNYGATMVFEAALNTPDKEGAIFSKIITLENYSNNVELRVWVSESSDFSISSVLISHL